MHRLIIAASQRLAEARTLADVTECITKTTRQMLQADGCCFVIREGQTAYYADEDAMDQLFVGSRFPLTSCVSGIAMSTREPVIVEDVETDPRAPQEIYGPTFVKSLVMVPIIADGPIGAIGAYWARRGRPSEDAVNALKTLARTSALAVQNLQLIASLRAGEARYRAVVEAQGEFIVRWRPDGICTFASPSFCERLGRANDEILGTVVFHPNHERTVFREQRERLSPEAPHFSAEYRVEQADKTVCWERWSHTALFDENGSMTEVQSVGRDVTEEFEVKRTLETTAAQLRAVFDGVQQAIVLFDTDFRLLTANSFAQRMAKHLLGSELPLGKRAPEIFGGFGYDGFERPANKALADGKARTSRRLKMGGKVRSLETHYHRVQDADGNNIGLVMSSLDTTEQTELETELRQRERVALMGQLALRVAHDFNNLLTPILCIASEWTQSEALSPNHRRDADLVVDAAERGASLTRQLLAFTRRGLLELSILDVNEVLRSVVTLLRRLAPSGVEISADPSPTRATMRGDSGQIHQLFMNLGVNAVDAVGGTGLVSFQTRVEQDRILVDVRDTGAGISEEDLPFIFDPHFSTKGEKGSGLGLATSAGIAEQHGGTIKATSETGRGASFLVDLPFFEGTRQPTSLAPLPISGTSFASILVVDGSKPVRMAVARAVDSKNTTAEEAENGSEALSKLKGTRSIDVLVADLHLSDMTGLELAERARRLLPGLRVVLMSTQKPESRPPSTTPHVVFLAKPFSRGQLHDALSRAQLGSENV